MLEIWGADPLGLPGYAYVPEADARYAPYCAVCRRLVFHAAAPVMIRFSKLGNPPVIVLGIST